MPSARVRMAPATEAKFMAADEAGAGYIECAALDAFMPLMGGVDRDKDGRISRAARAKCTAALKACNSKSVRLLN
jgi:hypothetical protein